MLSEAKVNILLVDDQPENLLTLEAILERLGQNLAKVTSGADALQCLHHQEFALILLNVQMPVMDGFETARRIRERPVAQHTPIIFIADSNVEGSTLGEPRQEMLSDSPSWDDAKTLGSKGSTLKGNRSDTHALRGYALGAVDYLLKPIVPEILLAKVSVFISVFQKTQEIKRQAVQVEARYQELQREMAKRRQAEAALQRANEKLKLKVAEYTTTLERVKFQARLLDAVEQSVIATDLQGTIIYWNRYAEVLYGWSAAEVLGCSIMKVTPADTTKEQAAEIMSHLQTGKSWSGEFWVKRRDGTMFPAMVTDSPIYDEHGKLTGIIGVSVDISIRKQTELALQELNQQLELRVQQRTTELQQANQQLQAEVKERRQVEEALRASEVRYKAIVENSYDIITLTDEQDNIYYQNSARKRILGYPSEELSGKRPVHQVHPEDIPNVQAAMSEILAQPGVPVTVEYRMQRVDGSWVWLESVATNWLGHPDIKAIVANTRDISDRIHAQDSLRQQVERERLITASVQRIRQTLDLEVILNTSVEEMREFLQVDRVLVYRVWSDGTGSTIAEATVPDCPKILGQTFPAEVFPQEFHPLYCQGRVRAVVNPETDAVTPCLIEFLSSWGVKSKLVVPIVCQRELWGLLIAHQCSQTRQWQPLEIDLLEQFGIQLAIAIVQANLYQQVQRELVERKQAQEALRLARDELELRVAARTVELTQMNQALQAQIHASEVAARHRIAAEEALRTSEERFRVALKNSPTTVFHQDSDLRYTWLYNALPGLSSIGKLDCELFATEDAQRLTAIKRRVLTTGVGTREEVFVTLNGEVRYYDLTIEPLLGSCGEITGITCAAMDITGIRTRERQLRAIFESSLDAIASIDDEGRYIEANPAACELLGMSLTELLGKPITDFIEPSCDFEQVWRAVIEVGKGTGELRLLRLDGTVRDVEYAAKANFLPRRHLAVVRDITERKQAEEIRRALEAEKELRRLQLRFFSMVSHEFRTPLSTILGSAQLLKSCTQTWTEEKKLRNLSRIETAAKNMTQLLDELLTINRAESGKLECNPQPLDLEKFCRRLVEDLQLQASSKHQITFTTQSACPMASLDEKLMHSILNNLLSNATKYSPKGGKINLDLTCNQNEAIFQIQDQGIGIPLEDQSHLFELFHRGKNVTNIPGTGLGLSVVKKCLDLQGGKIAITSAVGVGTTVTVTIPLTTIRR